jgi:hypothetical protein
LEQENPALKVITPRQQGVDKRLKKLASSSNAVNVFSRRSSYHRSKKKKIRIQPLNFLQKNKQWHRYDIFFDNLKTRWKRSHLVRQYPSNSYLTKNLPSLDRSIQKVQRTKHIQPKQK